MRNPEQGFAAFSGEDRKSVPPAAEPRYVFLFANAQSRCKDTFGTLFPKRAPRSYRLLGSSRTRLFPGAHPARGPEGRSQRHPPASRPARPRGAPQKRAETGRNEPGRHGRTFAPFPVPR